MLPSVSWECSFTVSSPGIQAFSTYSLLCSQYPIKVMTNLTGHNLALTLK